MVFQSPEEQIIATSVEEDIAFGPENLGLPAAEIRARVEDALRITGLEAERGRAPHLLSAGQMQRLALAGVLAMQPRLVLFDEPTTMIDPAGRRMLMEQIHALKSRGVTVVLITHHMDEAAQADRVIVLRAGRVELDGTPREVFSSPALDAFGLELPPAEVFWRGAAPAPAPASPAYLHPGENAGGAARHPPPARVESRPRPPRGSPGNDGAHHPGGGAGVHLPGGYPHGAPRAGKRRPAGGRGGSPRADRRHRQRQIHPAAAPQRAAQTPAGLGAGG